MPVHNRRRRALLLAAGCLYGLTCVAGSRAQEPVPTPPAQPSQTVEPAAPRMADLQILAKAFGDLLRMPVMEAQTETRMSGSGQGFNFDSRQQHRITVKNPSRFRAEIAMVKEDGSPGAKYIAVSNAVKVVTYRPGLKQYSSVTRADFENEGDEVSTLGLLGALYFNRDLLKGIAAITPQTQDAVLQELRKDGTTLSGVLEKVGDREYATYTLFLEKDKITLRFRLDPQTAWIAETEMNVKEKNLDVTMLEKIRSYAPLTAVPAGTFDFTPPPGVKRVKSLSVEPF